LHATKNCFLPILNFDQNQLLTEGISMTITKEILALRATLTRVKADLASAIADVQVNGLSVTVTVLDSHGVAISKPGLNHSTKIITAAEKLCRSLLRQLEALEDGQQKVERAQAPNP
jgi:hypothetical protein